MTSIEAETSRPVEVAADRIANQQNEEQHAAGHMQGWVLASLTLAFMSICFVLALDNTILGSWVSRGLQE